MKFWPLARAVVTRIPMDVKVGDKVLYSKYGGTEVHYEGEDYLIVGARDILAILG